MRLALPKIGRAAFVDRIARATNCSRADERLHEAAKQNWYVVSGDESLAAAI